MFNAKQIIKTSFLILAASSAAMAQASQKLVCVSDPVPSRASQSITIVDSGKASTVAGFAQGGMAHYVTSFGPFAATKEDQGGVLTYTWEDQFHQYGTVTVYMNRFVMGHRVITATTDFGLWANKDLKCSYTN